MFRELVLIMFNTGLHPSLEDSHTPNYNISAYLTHCQIMTSHWFFSEHGESQSGTCIALIQANKVNFIGALVYISGSYVNSEQKVLDLIPGSGHIFFSCPLQAMKSYSNTNYNSWTLIYSWMIYIRKAMWHLAALQYMIFVAPAKRSAT